MKRYLYTVMLLLGISMSIVSCGEKEPDTIPVAGVSLDKASIEVVEGDSFSLTPTITPNDATNKRVIWSSSNESVATVNNGSVTTHKAGTVTITVKTEDGNRTATCSVNVKEKTIPVTGVSLDKTTAEITEGESLTLTAAITPENATNKTIIWNCSDESIAKVENGVVTTIKAGSVKITAKSEDGNKTAECSIIVKEKVIKVSGVSLDKTSVGLVEGEQQSLTATVTPDNATNKNTTWSSSDESVAIVKDGVVTAIKEGTAKITVTTEDGGKTAICNITVSPKVYHVSEVSLDKAEAELVEGEYISLKATVKPDNATNKNVVWSSSNESVATVKDGVVTAIKEGNAKITVKTEDGGKTATCNVTIKAKTYPVTGVSISKTSAEITEGESFTLTATVTPDNASIKQVTWSSSDESVATVKDGVVTAIKEGKAKITVKTEDGGKTATCNVTIKAKIYPVTGVSLDKTSAEIAEGETLRLTATVTPNNATNKNVVWNSSNETVATVKDGVVTAIMEGSVKITVKTEDGGKTATCNIQVKGEEIINFEDKNVEKVCVSYYDKNGDGKLSLSEAAQVTALNSKFFGDYAPVVTSFTELKYFTSLNAIPKNCFHECRKLTKVTLPESVTTIGERGFLLCSSLEEINFSDRITSIGAWAFGECQSLKECFIPKTMTSLPNGMYHMCPSVTKLNIPNTVVSIGDNCFEYCSGVKEIIIPDSVTTIGQYAFANMYYVEKVSISSSIVSLKYRVFYRIGAKSITIPEGVLFADSEAFGEAENLEEIIIPSTMTSMKSICRDCDNLKTVICKAITPPTLEVYPFYGLDMYQSPFIPEGFKVYVPTQSVDKYKEADVWKEHADLIEGKAL